MNDKQDWTWVIREPTDVTPIIINVSCQVLRIDRIVPDYSKDPETLVLAIDYSDGSGEITMNGVREDISDGFGPVLGIFDDVLDALEPERGEKIPTGQKIPQNGWENDEEILHPGAAVTPFPPATKPAETDGRSVLDALHTTDTEGL